jgi:hypothetical protein
LVFCSSRFRDPQCGHGGFDEIRDGGMILFLIVGHPGKILSLWVFIIAKSGPSLPQKKIRHYIYWRRVFFFKGYTLILVTLYICLSKI